MGRPPSQVKEKAKGAVQKLRDDLDASQLRVQSLEAEVQTLKTAPSNDPEVCPILYIYLLQCGAFHNEAISNEVGKKSTNGLARLSGSDFLTEAIRCG